MKPEVTIRDVARAAGVSIGTVSRVVNGHPSVTAEKRALVTAAIKDLDYRPDVFAQSLRKGSSKTIGVVVPDLRNPFFAELMQEIEIDARALGYSVLFVSSDGKPETEAELITNLSGRKVDGILLVPSNRASVLDAPARIPVVVIDRPLDGRPYVAADHRGGARLAVDYLISLGHERIACISGPSDSPVADMRLAGFIDAVTPYFQTAALSLADYIAPSAFDYAGGRAAATTLLTGPRPRPTALFACSDQQAIGAMRAAADLDITVPRDLSIVGFDGISVSDLISPRLTTVVQPVTRIADAAVSRLIGKKRDRSAEAAELFSCELVTRESCAPPRDDSPRAVP